MSTSGYLQDPDEAEKAFFLYAYLQERKRWGPIKILRNDEEDASALHKKNKKTMR